MEETRATRSKRRAVEIRRRKMEGVKERAAQWREYGFPTQQSKQRVHKRVLDVVHGRGKPLEVFARHFLDPLRQGPRDNQIDAFSAGGTAHIPAREVKMPFQP